LNLKRWKIPSLLFLALTDWRLKKGRVESLKVLCSPSFVQSLVKENGLKKNFGQSPFFFTLFRYFPFRRFCYNIFKKEAKKWKNL
jgi:hypothetical protein